MIVAAAIRQDGVVYALPAPARHHDVIHHMVGRGLPRPITGEQGFIDHHRGFVGRERAGRIAIENGQIETLAQPPLLYSEDLW